MKDETRRHHLREDNKIWLFKHFRQIGSVVTLEDSVYKVQNKKGPICKNYKFHLKTRECMLNSLLSYTGTKCYIWADSDCNANILVVLQKKVPIFDIETEQSDILLTKYPWTIQQR